jgi:Zn-dependent metalloprotease
MKQSKLLVLVLAGFIATGFAGCASDKNSSPCLTCPGPNPAIAVARQYLADNQDRWPMRAGLDEWRIDYVGDWGGSFTEVRFNQHYRGVPVVGGYALVTVLEEGSIGIVWLEHFESVSVNTTPLILQHEALRLATQHLSSEGNVDTRHKSSEPRVYEYEGAYRLCWQFGLSTENDSWWAYWMYFVDARSGEIIDSYYYVFGPTPEKPPSFGSK